MVAEHGNIAWYLVFLTLRCDAPRGVWFRVRMHTVESYSEVWCTRPSFSQQWDAHPGVSYKFEYLCEIKKEIEKTLACLSGSQMGKGQKSSDTLPLSGPLSKCLWELAFPTLLAQTQKNSLICTLYSTHCIFKVADSNLSTVFGKIP